MWPCSTSKPEGVAVSPSSRGGLAVSAIGGRGLAFVERGRVVESYDPAGVPTNATVLSGEVTDLCEALG